CFLVDEEEIIIGATARIPELEKSGHTVESLYYETSIEFPGVVIRREFYEAHGGYMPSLVNTCSRKEWARAVSLGGGVVSTNVLACHRQFALTDGAAVVRSGENVRDLLRLAEVFRKRYPGFSSGRAHRIAAHMALQQARRFSAVHDND